MAWVPLFMITHISSWHGSYVKYSKHSYSGLQLYEYYFVGKEKESMDIASVVVFLCAIVPLTLGCDPSSWVEPTFERKIHYAKIIAFGNVTEILKKDPADLVGETYGAKVYIQCTYKGGPMPGWITIGGAGSY